MSKYYEVDLFAQGVFDEEYDSVAVVQLKSITPVARFIETVDFNYLTPMIYTPKNNFIDASEL